MADHMIPVETWALIAKEVCITWKQGVHAANNFINMEFLNINALCLLQLRSILRSTIARAVHSAKKLLRDMGLR